MAAMLDTPTGNADTAVNAGDRAALLEAERLDVRTRIEARDQRIRLLEEAVRLLNANTVEDFEALLPFSSLSGKANL